MDIQWIVHKWLINNCFILIKVDNYLFWMKKIIPVYTFAVRLYVFFGQLRNDNY